MIHIFTLKYGDKYSSDLVNDLYQETLRSDTRFYCYTDDVTSLNSNINIINLDDSNIVKYHWRKIDFFKNNFVGYDTNDQCIVMDIDQVIVDNVDPLLYYPVKNNQLVTYKAWHDGPCRINGGWYKFNSNQMHHVYEKFYSNPEHYQLFYYNTGIVDCKYYGEQNFVEESVSDIETMPTKFYSGRHASPTARIIHYSGPRTQIL